MPDIYIAKKKKKRKIPKAGRLARALAAFVVQPNNLRFETQEKKEKIVLLLRPHPIVNLPWLTLIIILFLTPFFILPILPLSFIPGNFRFICLLAWYLLSFAFAFEHFLTWFYHVFILTDERIIDIDFPTLLYRNIKECKIDKIEDINIRTSGYVRSFFNFGDVLIQTAGAVPEIRFEDVPNPEQVSKVLNDLMYEEEQEKLDGRVR